MDSSLLLLVVEIVVAKSIMTGQYVDPHKSNGTGLLITMKCSECLYGIVLQTIEVKSTPQGYPIMHNIF